VKNSIGALRLICSSDTVVPQNELEAAADVRFGHLEGATKQATNLRSRRLPLKGNFYYSYGKKKQGAGYQRSDRVTAHGIARDFTRRPRASLNAVYNAVRE